MPYFRNRQSLFNRKRFDVSSGSSHGRHLSKREYHHPAARPAPLPVVAALGPVLGQLGRVPVLVQPAGLERLSGRPARVSFL